MSNTYSASLVTAKLAFDGITDLQNQFAPLSSFSRDWGTDEYKPKAKVEVKHTTSGATAQTDATNFESGDSIVGAIEVVPHQITLSFQVSNADLNSGLRMKDLIEVNVKKFAGTVMAAAMAPITTANFGSPAVVSAAAAFSFSDLATLQASLKKSSKKNLILDGAYLARISNTPGFFQKTGVLGGVTNAYKAFGWDNICENTDFTGADTHVVGFACNPQAIACALGTPVQLQVPGDILQRIDITLDQLEMKVACYSWFNPSTRTLWASYDCMAGFALGDSTAGFLVTSQ